jgi:UPF0716 protein FxsA|tara:strand:- start:5528 stop:5941 length:414 start_codon:yes stop_codon:yes gene_type:complete
MNTAFLLIIFVLISEIYLLIKIGTEIGAFSTVLLILLTAFIGLIYVRYEGFNTLKSAITQLIRNEIPVFEIVSGASLVIGAFLLIIPGFLTDILGLLFVIPISRKFFFRKITSKYKVKRKNFIEGEYEDIDDKKNNE